MWVRKKLFCCSTQRGQNNLQHTSYISKTSVRQQLVAIGTIKSVTDLERKTLKVERLLMAYNYILRVTVSEKMTKQKNRDWENPLTKPVPPGNGTLQPRGSNDFRNVTRSLREQLQMRVSGTL
jgi:hypothetical protein